MQLKTYTMADIRALNPCKEHEPGRYAPEDWQGTIIDVLKLEAVPACERIWVATRKGILPKNIIVKLAQNCATRAKKHNAAAAAAAAAYAAYAAAAYAAADAAAAAAYAADAADAAAYAAAYAAAAAAYTAAAAARRKEREAQVSDLIAAIEAEVLEGAST